MTVYAKNNTYGVETRVAELQNFLNVKLANFWSGNIDIYGILFKLKKRIDNRDVFVPEAYKGTSVGDKEYSEVVINDKSAATIGFIIQDRSTTPFMSANIDVVFTLNMPLIYTDNTERNTEKALLQAKRIIDSWSGSRNTLDIKEGVDDVFYGFDTERIKHRDMHPWYVFSLNIELQYTDNSCQ